MQVCRAVFILPEKPIWYTISTKLKGAEILANISQLKSKDVKKEVKRIQKLPEYEQKRVNVDFPVWMINSLDKEAKRLGIARQALIKMLVSAHIESHA